MKRCTKTMKPLVFEYTSRGDMAMDIRDIGQIIVKINEIIERINDLPKRKGKK